MTAGHILRMTFSVLGLLFLLLFSKEVAALADAGVRARFEGIPASATGELMAAQASAFGIMAAAVVFAALVWLAAVRTIGRFLWPNYGPVADLPLVAIAPTTGVTKVRAHVVRIYFSNTWMATWWTTDKALLEDLLGRLKAASAYSAEDSVSLVEDSTKKNFVIPGRAISHWTISEEDMNVPNGTTANIDLTRSGPDERKPPRKP